MRLIKFVVVIIILSQILSNGKALPALAAGFNAVTPVVVQVWEKQAVMNKDIMDKEMAISIRARMVTFVLPKIKRVVNIEKIAEDLHRLKKRTDNNV